MAQALSQAALHCNDNGANLILYIHGLNDPLAITAVGVGKEMLTGQTKDVDIFIKLDAIFAFSFEIAEWMDDDGNIKPGREDAYRAGEELRDFWQFLE